MDLRHSTFIVISEVIKRTFIANILEGLEVRMYSCYYLHIDEKNKKQTAVLFIPLHTCEMSLSNFTLVKTIVRLDRLHRHPILNGYRTGSTIYLCMYEEMHTPGELVSSGCSCLWTHTNKSLHKCDDAIIIYVLLHLKNTLSDIKSYIWQEKKF